VVESKIKRFETPPSFNEKPDIATSKPEMIQEESNNDVQNIREDNLEDIVNNYPTLSQQTSVIPRHLVSGNWRRCVGVLCSKKCVRVENEKMTGLVVSMLKPPHTRSFYHPFFPFFVHRILILLFIWKEIDPCL
jgi:hypothetical protein